MGLRRTYQLVCDECGRLAPNRYDTPRHARQAAKRNGWYRYVEGEWPGPNNKDLCPDCAEKFLAGKEVSE